MCDCRVEMCIQFLAAHPTAFKDTFPALSRAGEHGGHRGPAGHGRSWTICQYESTWNNIQNFQSRTSSSNLNVRCFHIRLADFFVNHASMDWDGEKSVGPVDGYWIEILNLETGKKHLDMTWFFVFESILCWLST